MHLRQVQSNQAIVTACARVQVVAMKMVSHGGYRCKAIPRERWVGSSLIVRRVMLEEPLALAVPTDQKERLDRH